MDEEEADAFADELIEAEMERMNPDEDGDADESEPSVHDVDYLDDNDDLD